jgi:hypothetical protein
VLSRHTVLPWEDRREYEALLDALVGEHAPEGPTEEHLVEKLAGVIWRKQRVRMAETAVYREKLLGSQARADPSHAAPVAGGSTAWRAGLICLAKTPVQLAETDIRDVTVNASLILP